MITCNNFRGIDKGGKINMKRYMNAFSAIGIAGKELFLYREKNRKDIGCLSHWSESDSSADRYQAQRSR